jgi:hypothetical protein
MMMWNVCVTESDLSPAYQLENHNRLLRKYPLIFMTEVERTRDREWRLGGYKGMRPIISKRSNEKEELKA